jgi:imidazolonepropionase-like amidohydrolase
MKRLSIFFIFLFFIFTALGQETFPKNDIAFDKNDCYAFTNVTLIKQSDQPPITNATLVIKNGKVLSFGQSVSIPADAQVKDCKGKYIYPSFIDIYSDYGTPPPPRSGGRGFNTPSVMTNDAKYAAGWNSALKAEADASKVFQLNNAKAKEYRSNGFGLVNTHIMDGIVRGTGSIVALSNVKENLAMLREKSSAHFSFSKGSSNQDYPNSLMGSIALLRQTFLDAQWYKNKPATEGTNLSLTAFNQLLQYPLIFECGDKWNDLRANKIANEFGINFILLAGTNEYQRINEIKNTKAKLIVPLNFPNAMDVEDPNDARMVSLADMKHWELAPSNPASIEKAGIVFALTMNGLKESSGFMANLNKAVQYGLSENMALDALTRIPASMLGISDQSGTLDAGKLANFIITSGPLFKEKTNILQNWIQGEAYEIKGEGWNEFKADYVLTVNQNKYNILLSGESLTNPTAKIINVDTTKLDMTLNDKLISLSFSFKQDSGKTNRLSGVAIGDGWNGTGVLVNGEWVRWSLVKNSMQSMAANPSKKEMVKKPLDLSPVLYPFQGFGNATLPQATDLLIKNATIWTSEKDGILEHSDLLIQNGKISRIGRNLSAPGANIIDASGKQITPGIIDEHSHIAGTGSINECSQSVTAEVRIGDIINPDDINIYRQLSGGVTTSHILHGSCNTIGGQTQLIKLRWGKNAEEMKFEGWPGFIKFALGENVKRTSSNVNNRFPDTRMGVEQVLEDAFQRASDYQKAGTGKRIDLELEALSEILNQKRFITCHSYVASEILALLNVADKYHFNVNTFTHILEGYKVADQLKKHGSAAAGFSDWWAYKMEVQDAIPQNATIMNKMGINVAINSDDAEMARRLNQEAAKSIKYGDMSETDALKMVTINPATMLKIGDRTGSIKVGKDADIVIWSDHPLSIYAKAEKTIVDGIIYFDREKDTKQQQYIATEKNRLVQKMIGAKKGGAKTDTASPSFQEEAQCELDHQHSNDLWHRLELRMMEINNN